MAVSSVSSEVVRERTNEENKETEVTPMMHNIVPKEQYPEEILSFVRGLFVKCFEDARTLPRELG